ncbi:primase-helicase zinc-binding domain-containing protein [Oleidesulfovibrio sp.]|uniref:primase-helicase zinc-binding domain-containing protein n=1 Tax=Oleidesulfovibrio sp. TaxID=2909707 RepID=UPI003A84EC5F
MTRLLDFYRMRFGDAVKKQGNGYNGPCPLCGGEPGKSDRFVIWEDRSHDLGKICSEHSIAGVWSCRQCGKAGDTVSYLVDIEGMTFREAAAELGVAPSRHQKRRCAPQEPRPPRKWEPASYEMPSAKWMEYVDRLAAEAAKQIELEKTALAWLAARGIDAEAVRKYHIGYLKAEGKNTGRYRARSALGLAPKKGNDGRVRTKIFIPRGITIPTLNSEGQIINLRIRRPKPDLKNAASPKYMELEGSARAPLFLPASRPAQLSAYFVTEAELDAMLIHHATKGQVGALAVRTNRGKPDTTTHTCLAESTLICLALDYDDPGEAGLTFWLDNYPTATEWPTPEGKDPGEAFALGVDICEWVAAALPPSIPFEFGQVDTFSAGVPLLGDGDSTNSLSTAGCVPAKLTEQFTEAELCTLRKALPAYLTLSEVPAEVCRAYLLWCGVATKLVKDDAGGFSWEMDYRWRSKNRKEFEAFFAYQDSSQALWDWLAAHEGSTITASNLLCCRG